MIFSSMLFLYSGLLVAVLVGGLPYWLLRVATASKYREGLGERLGAVPRRLVDPHARAGADGGARTIWVHAVSVGEVVAVTELVKALRTAGERVVVSTTTPTGQRMARERFGAESVFYFPIDLGWIVGRYLRALRPALLVLTETELWPRMMVECRRRAVPIAVVNARISDRSYPRYLRLRRVWRPVLESLSLVLAQSEQDVERLKAIGVPADRVRLCGNLKFDVRPATDAAVTLALREYLPAGMRLLVCGSTVAGEEAMLLAAWTDLVAKERGIGACMVLAPRHPERFSIVAKLLDQSGLTWVRRSEWMRTPEPLRAGSVFLLNTVGELASVYSLATVAFVGGSLVPAGGHNPLEPAQLGAPVVMGRHFHNFRTIVRRMIAEDAIRIVGRNGVAPAPVLGRAVRGSRAMRALTAAWASALSATLGGLLEHEDEAKKLGARGLAVFRSQSGATGRSVEALLALLPSAGEKASQAAARTMPGAAAEKVEA